MENENNNTPNNVIRTNFDTPDVAVNSQPINGVKTNLDDNVFSEEDDYGVNNTGIGSVIKAFIAGKLLYLVGSFIPFWIFWCFFISNKFYNFIILGVAVILFIMLLYISLKNIDKVRGRTTSNNRVAKVIIILGVLVLIYIIFKIKFL